MVARGLRRVGAVDLRIFTEPQMGASYDDQLRVAQTAEAAGYDAFFRSDHFLVTGNASGEPGPTDSWVTLGALARETSRIRLGTLVTSATFRLPGPLAITVAQVDAMSRGRVELGLGSGWFAAEINVAFVGMDAVAAQFARVEAACREIGRDPGELVRSTAQTIAVGRDDAEVARRAMTIGRDAADLRANGLAGTVAEVVDRLGQWREKTGITRVYLQLMDLADLDQVELIGAEVAPRLG